MSAMLVMPMFPLGSVLLPGEVLPLQIFEPRYRLMLEEVLGSDTPEFGVVLIDRGSEVGGGDQRAVVGCAARIVQVAPVEDGRWFVVAVGVRRIVVEQWLDDDPYPRAIVTDGLDSHDGPDSGHEQLASRLAARVRSVGALAVELGLSTADHAPPLSDDLTELSYQLVSLAPLGAADRFDLLAARGPADRLAMLDHRLDDVEAAMRFRLLNQGEMP